MKPTQTVDDNGFTPLVMPASRITEPLTIPSPPAEQVLSKVLETGVSVVSSFESSSPRTRESIEQAADSGTAPPTNALDPNQAGCVTIDDLFSSVAASGRSIIQLPSETETKPVPVAQTLQVVESSMLHTANNIQPMVTLHNDPAIVRFKIADDTAKPKQHWQPTHSNLALTSALQAGQYFASPPLPANECFIGQDDDNNAEKSLHRLQLPGIDVYQVEEGYSFVPNQAF
jgi:hypothetical protein